MVVALETHSERLEVPENRSKDAEPITSQDDVEASQGQHEQIADELFLVDDYEGRPTDAGVRNAVAIGNPDGEAWLGFHDQVEVVRQCLVVGDLY